MRIEHKKWFVFISLCVILFITGFLTRYYVLTYQYKVFGYPLPFDLESAIEYRYVEMLFSNRKLPPIDKAIEWPYGVNPSKHLEIGAEYVYAFLAKIFPPSLPLEDRIRIISIGWFCLGIVFISVWIKIFTSSSLSAFAGGLYYATGLAPVMRSTGQELSHENFAIPLLILYLAFSSAVIKGGRTIYVLILSLLATLSITFAMATWDLIQYPIMVFHSIFLVNAVLSRLSKEETILCVLSTAGLTIAGIINPYLASHHFLTSPAMLLGYSSVLAICFDTLIRKSALHFTELKYKLAKTLIATLPFFAVFLMAPNYWAHYSHFTELLWAKLRFFNIKPSDPSLLTFNQRILWAPALDSVNLELTFYLFPAILLPSFFAVFLLIKKSKEQHAKNELRLIVFFALSLITFFLFKRFLVFLAICCAGLCGWLLKYAIANEKWLIKTTIIGLVSFGIIIEGVNPILYPSRCGHKIQYLSQRKELIE